MVKVRKCLQINSRINKNECADKQTFTPFKIKSFCQKYRKIRVQENLLIGFYSYVVVRYDLSFLALDRA